MTNRDKNILGQILAKTYRIERFLGVGTVGTVYVARHVRSGGLYAVKVLHRKLAASPDLYQRFQDEARLIATLRHPHILPITDFDRDENGIPFFVMDLLEGENLQQRLKHKEVLPIGQALEIISQAGSALQTAHRSGIVHRDVKPENLFLVRHDLGDRVTETTKVMDFGLARFRRLTPTGTRDASLGISAYMAPELLQESSTPSDGRADQWALAVIIYRMLTGKLPFDDSNQDDLLGQILNDPPRPFPKLSPELPAHIVAAIHRGMAKRREDRYESTMDFVKALSSRTSAVSGPEAGDAVPQPRTIAGSGRVTAPMPPIPSGAIPPPIPSAASASPPPSPVPNTQLPPSPSASIAAPRPAGSPPPSPHQAPPPPPAAPVLLHSPPPPQAPAPVVVAAKPSTASPAAPLPPLLHAPPLLLPESSLSPQAAPARRSSRGLLIGGGVLAVLAGVGLTLAWEQRQHARPTLPPQTVIGGAGGAPMVVEALPPPVALVPTVGSDGGLAPRIGVPPLRAAGDDLTAPPPVTPPAAQPVGSQPPSLPSVVAAPALAVPPGPGASPPTNGSPPLPSPTGPASAGPRPVAGIAAVPPLPSGVAPPPAVPPPVAPPPSIPTPPGSHQTRDEVDELLGNVTGRTAPAPAAVAPPPVVPAAAPPRPAQRPAAPRPVAEPAEPPAPPESAEKILEDAQAAYVRGERQRAIELALQVTNRGNPAEATKAWRFIGSAACSVRSSSLATRAYNNLAAPEHKQLLSELCKRNGLGFHDGQFSSE